MLPKNNFVELAIKTRCHAFKFRGISYGFEFHKDLSSKLEYPRFKHSTVEFEFNGEKKIDGRIQGSFNVIPDENAEANLWLVLSHLEELEVEYYTFWREVENQIEGKDGSFFTTEWVIWTPEVDMDDWDKIILEKGN